jgi:hypothetical protein
MDILDKIEEEEEEEEGDTNKGVCSCSSISEKVASAC